MAVYELTLPLDDATVEKLQVGGRSALLETLLT